MPKAGFSKRILLLLVLAVSAGAALLFIRGADQETPPAKEIAPAAVADAAVEAAPPPFVGAKEDAEAEGVLQGRVVRDADGTPVGGAEVRAYFASDAQPHRAVADEEGRFRMPLPRDAGACTLVALHSELNLASFAPLKVDFPESAAPEEHVLRLAEGAAVAGRVFCRGGGSPVVGAAIVVRGAAAWQGAFSAETDKDGRYEVAGLFSGTYTATVKPPIGFHVASGERNPAQKLKLAAGERRDRVNFGFEARAVSGRVINEDGHPIEGAQVRLARGHEAVTRFFEGLSTANGAFLLEGMPPERHYLSVAAQGYAGYGKYLQIPADGLNDFEVVLMAPCQVSGQIVDAMNEPVADVLLKLLPAPDIGHEYHPASVRSGGDGQYNVPAAPAGIYTPYVEYSVHGAQRGHGLALQQIHVPPGVSEVQQLLTLPLGNAELAGHVFNEAGEPLEGVELTINEASASTRSDESGYFHFWRLAGPTVRLYAELKGYSAEAFETPVDITDLHVTLPNRVDLIVYVYDRETGQPITDCSVRVPSVFFPNITGAGDGMLPNTGEKVKGQPGHFFFPDMAPGMALLEIDAPGYVSYVNHDVPIYMSQSPQIFEAPLDLAGTLVGTLTVPEGSIAQDQPIDVFIGDQMVEAGAQRQPHSRSKRFDKDGGAFRFELPAGQYPLIVKATGPSGQQIYYEEVFAIEAGRITELDVVLGVEPAER